MCKDVLNYWTQMVWCCVARFTEANVSSWVVFLDVVCDIASVGHTNGNVRWIWNLSSTRRCRSQNYSALFNKIDTDLSEKFTNVSRHLTFIKRAVCIFYFYFRYSISVQRFNDNCSLRLEALVANVHGVLLTTEILCAKGRCKARIVACRTPAVTVTGTTARGIGFLATIFGRQAVGKVLATREKVIFERERVGTKNNEATGGRKIKYRSGARENRLNICKTFLALISHRINILCDVSAVCAWRKSRDNIRL